METQMKLFGTINFLMTLQTLLHSRRTDMNIGKQQLQKTIITSRL